MPRPHDRALLIFPHPDRPDERRFRHWWIQQPPPSVAMALQARVAAACGDAATHVLASFFADEEQGADFEANKRTMGEALALQTLRRARSGKALFNLEDGIACTERLWAVVRYAQVKSGGGLDALTLIGMPERVPRSAAFRWTSPSLLHALLLASSLRYDGEVPEGEGPLPALADGPVQAPAPAGASPESRAAYAVAWRRYSEDVKRAKLRDAVSEGSVSAFVAALDEVVCCPDELLLLSAWAVLHLWRPF